MTKILLISIIAISVLSMGLSPVFAEKAITMKLFETEYNTSGTIFVQGNVDTKKTSTPVNLTVYDPNGTIVYKPSVSLDSDGNFKWLVKPTLPSFQQGLYTIEATHLDVETATITTFYVEGLNISELTEIQEIPEFGAFAMIILSISIVAIIIASTKMKVINILGN